MHNTKNSFLKMLKKYLQLINTLLKFLTIKSIVVLKMETKKLIKNELGKSHICEWLSFFPKPSLSKVNEWYLKLQPNVCVMKTVRKD